MVYNAIVQEMCTFAAMGATGPKLKFRSQASVPATGGPEFNSANICHVQEEADLRLLSTAAGGPVGAVRRGGALRFRREACLVFQGTLGPSSMLFSGRLAPQTCSLESSVWDRVRCCVWAAWPRRPAVLSFAQV